METLLHLLHLLPAAAYLGSAVGQTILNRTLLLTDKFKFPYPLAVTLFQLLFAAVLGLLFRLLLRILLPWRIRYGAYLHTYDKIDDVAQQTDREDGKRAVHPATEAQRSSWPIKDYFRPQTETQAGGGNRMSLVLLSTFIALRLVVGNLLMSRIAFPSFVLAMAASPAIMLPFSYYGSAAPGVLITFAAILALCFAAAPLTVAVALPTTALIALMSILDAATCAAMSLTLHHPSASHINANTPHLNLKTRFRLLIESRLHLIYSTSGKFNVVAIVASIFVLLCFLLSRELQDMRRNCYVFDDSQFWKRIAGGGAVQGPTLLLIMLLATGAAPLTLSFLQLALGSIVLPIFSYPYLSPQGWINLSMCWVFCVVRAIQCFDDSSSSAHSVPNRSLWSLAKKAFLALLIYGAIYQGSYTIQEYVSFGKISMPNIGKADNVGQAAPPTDHSRPTVNFGGPANDAFFGARPSPDTVIDIDLIMSHCYNSQNESGVFDILHCLSYLAKSQEEYFAVGQPASSQGQRHSGGLGRVWGKSKHTSGISGAVDGLRTPLSRQDECDGETYLFHTYWTGAATWRFELFIKGFLYTQNLSCSRLWIWLDTDIEPDAIDKMRYHDPIFHGLQPLLDNGYISLQRWSIPDRIPLPHSSEIVQSLQQDLAQEPSRRGEEYVSENIIRDAASDFWLVPDQLYKTVSTPTQVSDFVRFFVLHMHGGLYLDLDVLLMRDMRPLLLPNPAQNTSTQPAWAEQWVEHGAPADYNTALLALPANSSLSTYLIHGGLRMGMNFHPLALGRMLCGDGRNDELIMWHTAMFDPLVTNLRRKGTTLCTVPCHKNFESSFMGVVDEPEKEWSNYRGPTQPVGKPSSSSMSLGAGTNRTLENFFRGSFAYHIHNQWWKFPDPNSWMDVITQAHDGFFQGRRTNPYGELWGGPPVDEYDRSLWGWPERATQ